MKPLYKRRDSGVEDGSDDEENLSFSLSRRGSRFSCQSNSSKAKSLTGTEDSSGQKEQVKSRWKRVLGITRAVGRWVKLLQVGECLNLNSIFRFSVLSKNKDGQEQE